MEVVTGTSVKCLHCDFPCIHLSNTLPVKETAHLWWPRQCGSQTFNHRKLRLCAWRSVATSAQGHSRSGLLPVSNWVRKDPAEDGLLAAEGLLHRPAGKTPSQLCWTCLRLHGHLWLSHPVSHPSFFDVCVTPYRLQTFFPSEAFTVIKTLPALCSLALCFSEVLD